MDLHIVGPFSMGPCLRLGICCPWRLLVLCHPVASTPKLQLLLNLDEFVTHARYCPEERSIKIITFLQFIQCLIKVRDGNLME